MERSLQQIDAIRNLIDRKLQEYLIMREPLLRGLEESVNYSLFSGGKRIRPVFCFLVGEMFCVPPAQLLSVACAVEMIHTASLIMDDLPHMDDERLRRGRPANHLVYGQDVASLASVGLLMKAYEVVLADDCLPDEKKIPVVTKLASVVGIDGMVGGQFADLKYMDKSMTYATLEFIHIHKTASLFVATGEVAAIIGNAAGEEVEAIRTFAKNLGFAFQISDDILDATAAEADIGKSVHHDKGNFVTLFGVGGSRARMKEHTQKALDALEIFGEKSASLVLLSKILLARKS